LTVAVLATFPPLADIVGAQQRFRPDRIASDAVVLSRARLHALEDSVRRLPGNAAALFELGTLAWGLATAARDGEIVDDNPLRLARLADSALQASAAMAEQNVPYQLFAANRMLASNVAVARVGARKYFERAVKASREQPDSSLRAAAALEYGRTFWWRFDAAEHRHRFNGAVAPRSISDAMQPLARGAASMEAMARVLMAQEIVMAGGGGGIASNPNSLTQAQVDRLLQGVSVTDQQFTNLPKNAFKGVRELITAEAQALPYDLQGWPDFEAAERLFNEAYAAQSTYPGAFRAVAMLHAARGLWGDLGAFARAHAHKHPQDSLAWMALGLSSFRRGDLHGAHAAFDSALALMSEATRKKFDTWTRVLPPDASVQSTNRSASAEQLYWHTASPLLSDIRYNARLEFLARLTFAELRWTVEEFGIGGADTDRGQTHVRYGPPERIIGFGPAFTDDAADVVQFWLYPSGLIFAFRGMPTFGTMRLAGDDAGMNEEIKSRFPVRWDNVALPQVDSIPASAARFRAGDSLDVAVSAGYSAPDSIAASMDVAGPVRRHLWMLNENGPVRHLESPLDAEGVHLWRVRLAPGTFAFRVEAHGETAMRGQRGTGIVDATTPEFPLAGFGVSDILLARDVGGAGTRRWSELQIAPTTGVIATSEPIVMLWENYDFASHEGRAVYDVALELRRQQGRGARIRAQILGALASLARTETGEDHVTFRFSRDVPHAAAFADWVQLSLPEAPPGTYVVSLTVSDRNSGREARRSTFVTIADR
jgi:GWxTD domain-containing protein